ncbi:MAG: DNA polymerase III subunit delta [Oscillospiraceae bacterium]|nr:DNA polymerase III subunit delta [Oscillospiraceae bacterium]MDD3832319.1 DNA polymerase III subunit delta [Oscillospiraceae bacterium]MDD4545736.1 DNA polymerase III subunit delta [Oscillospiraceae bacterium]
MLTESELKKQIKSKELASVYFLFGEENYLSSHYAEQIAQRVVGNHPLAEFNHQKFDGQVCTVGDIEEAVEALPVMAERKCVVVRDFDLTSSEKESREQLNALISDPPQSCVLIFWLDAVQADVKKNSIWRGFSAAVDKVGFSVMFPRKAGSEIVRLLCSGAERRGCSLSTNNARLMLQRSGNDLNLLLTELDKLCALADGGEVTRDIIEGLGTENLEASIFNLSKEILQGSYARAYNILNGLLSKREDPVSILGVLSNAYSDLYCAKVALAAGVRAESLVDDLGYRGKEFLLRNAARDCARIPLPILRESLEALAQADRQLKSTRVDDRVILEQTVARLILLSRQGARV